MKEESYIRNVKYFLEELIRGCGIIQKENPAVQFTKDAKAGLSTIEQKTPSDESVGDECSFFLVMNVFPFLFFDSLLLNVLF